MLCYARSGGTILNKCLACLPNVVMLSEVNALGGGWGKEGKDSSTTPYQQMQEWYGANHGMEGLDFSEQLDLVENDCWLQDNHFIVRDWTTVDFTKHRYNNNNPSFKLNTYNTMLDLFGENLKTFAFVRDSIDVWISRGCPDIDEFYFSYNSYLNYLLLLQKEDKIQIFKYEEFCGTPKTILTEITNYLGINCEPYIINKVVDEDWMYYTKVNGDTQNSYPATDYRSKCISPLSRKPIGRVNVDRINNSKHMILCNNALGYEINY